MSGKALTPGEYSRASGGPARGGKAVGGIETVALRVTLGKSENLHHASVVTDYADPDLLK